MTLRRSSKVAIRPACAHAAAVSDAGKFKPRVASRRAIRWRGSMDMTRRAAAEFFGTFWLTFGGCGAAVLAAGYPTLGIGFLGVGVAFGGTVLTMAYGVGQISGGHFNPAVTVGLWAGGRCSAADVVPYIVAQVIGAIVAAA